MQTLLIKILTNALIAFGDKIVSLIVNLIKDYIRKIKLRREVEDAFNQDNPADIANDLDNIFR